MNKTAKKILTFLLVLCMASGFMAYAEDAPSGNETLTIRKEFDVTSNKLIISGDIKCNKRNIPVVMTVMYGETLIDAQQILADAPIEGIASYVFDGIQFKNSTPSGEYKMYVSAGAAGGEISDIYNYDGVDKRFILLTDLNDKIEAYEKTQDYNAFVSFLQENKSLVCSGDEALFDLGDDGKKKFVELFTSKGTYDEPSDYESDENVDTIMKSLGNIAKNYTNVLSVASAVEIINEETLDAWLDKYAEANGFYVEDTETSYSEVTMSEYLKEVKSQDELYEKLSGFITDAQSFDDVRSDMLTAGILTVLEDANYYKLSEVTDSLSELFKVDRESFDNLSLAKQTAVYQTLTDMSFESINDYITAFDNAVKTQKNSTSSNSGGSGGGGGRKTEVYLPAVTTPQGSTQTIGGFNDLEGFEWAHEAIKYLSDKKVVSGRGNGIFDPGAQVTRAEFVKMIIEALDVADVSYNNEFADVSKDTWYAPYIASASAAGIVNGVNENNFMPDSPITKQDMIVILFRAGNMTPSESESEVYTDSAQISAYAKSAVYTMYEKGIVVGSGDGTLSPLKNASRAEAAQMIYRMLTALR